MTELPKTTALTPWLLLLTWLFAALRRQPCPNAIRAHLPHPHADRNPASSQALASKKSHPLPQALPSGAKIESGLLAATVPASISDPDKSTAKGPLLIRRVGNPAARWLEWLEVIILQTGRGHDGQMGVPDDDGRPGMQRSPKGKLMKMRVLILALMGIAGFGVSAWADADPYILLLVDDSNPSAVVITATVTASKIEDYNTSTYDGATLLQFFTFDVTSAAKGNLTGDLASMSSLGPSFSYYKWVADHGSGSYVDLNLYARSAITETQEFSTSWQAFVGTDTIDFSAFAAALPALGASGDIRAGWSGGSGQVIGSWLVIPEPSTAGLLGLGLAGLAMRRRSTVRGRPVA